MGLKKSGNKHKVERIKRDINRSNFYYYAGEETDLEEKVALGYDRLSPVVGNISPAIVSQWLNKLTMNEEITKRDREEIKIMRQQV